MAAPTMGQIDFDANLNCFVAACQPFPQDLVTTRRGHMCYGQPGAERVPCRGSLFGDIVAAVLQGAPDVAASAGSINRKRAPRFPTDPTPLEVLGFAFGSAIVLASFFGYAVHLYQWKQERNVLTHAAARAAIVFADRKQTRNNRFTDALIDYERQTPAGPVTCRNAPARFKEWSQDFEVGKVVEVYPQPGSCYRPIYAPDIGNPRTSLLVSLIAFPIGMAFFGAGYWSFRRRSSETQQVMSVATHATARAPE
jgi:hypothetical protein